MKPIQECADKACYAKRKIMQYRYLALEKLDQRVDDQGIKCNVQCSVTAQFIYCRQKHGKPEKPGKQPRKSVSLNYCRRRFERFLSKDTAKNAATRQTKSFELKSVKNQQITNSPISASPLKNLRHLLNHIGKQSHSKDGDFSNKGFQHILSSTSAQQRNITRSSSLQNEFSRRGFDCVDIQYLRRLLYIWLLQDKQEAQDLVNQEQHHQQPGVEYVLDGETGE